MFSMVKLLIKLIKMLCLIAGTFKIWNFTLAMSTYLHYGQPMSPMAKPCQPIHLELDPIVQAAWNSRLPLL